MLGADATAGRERWTGQSGAVFGRPGAEERAAADNDSRQRTVGRGRKRDSRRRETRMECKT